MAPCSPLQWQDPTAVALSLEYARRSNVFVASQRTRLPHTIRLTIDVPDFVKRARWHAEHVARFVRAMRAALPNYGGYLTLTYEEMLRTPQRALHRVFGERAMFRQPFVACSHVYGSPLAARVHQHAAPCAAMLGRPLGRSELPGERDALNAPHHERLLQAACSKLGGAL